MRNQLADLELLFLDCQTTSGSPAKGHLLEVGWCKASASCGLAVTERVQSHIVRLPRGARIPPQISRLTGITTNLLVDGITRNKLWARLDVAASMGVDVDGAEAFCVAHFARFEEKFVRHLHNECVGETPFPFRFVCTHEIAKRLFPDLPRRGLRALSGYFGQSLPELKRAASHVGATIAVWAGLIKILRETRGIEDIEGLLDLLNEQPPRRGTKWAYPLLREERLELPDASGVYRLKGLNGSVLYVGKALSLKNRVNSYYRKRRAEDKVLELVSQVYSVDVTTTETGVEAALFEAEEIKALDPPYNRALRDRGQEIWFPSHDLTSSSRLPSEHHFLGPVPNKEPIESLCQIAKVLGRDRTTINNESETLRVLGLRYAQLEPDALISGFRILREKFTDTALTRLPRVLLAFGARSQKERSEVKRGSVKKNERELPKPDSKGCQVIDAERVAEFLEESIINSSALIRRGLWLCSLSESTICWHPQSKSDGRLRRVLVFKSGALMHARYMSFEEDHLLPPDWNRSRLERLSHFDRTIYDRLRILNTELRRLVASGCEVEVVLGPGRKIDTPKLLSLMRVT